MSVVLPSQPRWKLARETADKLTAVYASPPIPVLEIAEQQGVRVRVLDFGGMTDRVSGYCDFGARHIVVNGADSLGRKMFTIAHELGHWMLHRNIFESDPEKYSVLPRFLAAAKTPLEQEANVFAAELLVPKHLLAPVRHSGAVVLAPIFGTSREMMENQLKYYNK